MIRHQPNRLLVSRMSDDILREDTRDPRRPMNPLAGIRATHRITHGYREASPYGDGVLFVLEWNCSAHSHPTANYSLLTSNSSYTFSAKERDPETGLSYFGSRYYSSDLSVWLSVDPMSDKYPSLSPYTYCANNPVRCVDPDGEEIYEFDENGKYLRTSGDKGSPDQIAIIKENGEITMSQAYQHGTIQLGLKGTVNQKDGTPVDVQSLNIKGDAQALDCFKFVADNSKSEWSLVRVGSFDGVRGLNYLSSSQEVDHNASTNLLNGTKLVIREHWHSHPDGIMTPSKTDYDAHNSLFDYKYIRTDMTGYVPTFIYSHGRQRQYSPFLKMLEDNFTNAWNEWRKEAQW